ncbi:MAG: serine/threonine protein kinase [Bryobacteraceae bacterium]
MLRRDALKLLAATPAAAIAGTPGGSFVFKARGISGMFGGGERLAFMNADGNGLRVYDFGRPNHTGWGAYDFFRDGRRALLLSIEMDEDWKTKPFTVFYPKSRTHIWICDLPTGRLTEIARKNRIAPFYAPCALLPDEERMLVGVNFGGREQLFSMDLDGTRAHAITKPDEYVYGVSVSPDGARIAFHADYNIHTARIDGSNRVAVAGRKGYIYFGTSWSPDSRWVLFQVCEPKTDPGHDWSDIWIGRPDGSMNRQLTQGESAWFASSFGRPDNPGDGSIMPRWAPDGSGILYARRLANSKVPWEFQPNRPDTNHFNRDFKPELARGGTQICFLNPEDGSSTPLTQSDPPQWDFRPDWSRDSKRILFCRAKTGENPAIWVMDRDGKHQRRLTGGINGNGADFPRWVG